MPESAMDKSRRLSKDRDRNKLPDLTNLYSPEELERMAAEKAAYRALRRKRGQAWYKTLCPDCGVNDEKQRIGGSLSFDGIRGYWTHERAFGGCGGTWTSEELIEAQKDEIE